MTARVLSRDFTEWFRELCAAHAVIVRRCKHRGGAAVCLTTVVPGNAVRALVRAALEARWRGHEAELADLVQAAVIEGNLVSFPGFRAGD